MAPSERGGIIEPPVMPFTVSDLASRCRLRGAIFLRRPECLLANNPIPNGGTAPLILIVDDDHNGAKYLARLLRLAGYETVVHRCGADALDGMAHTLPALVILDIDMPMMDGLECLGLIRGDERFAAVPVVMYSGDFTYERMSEAKRLGAEDFVVKGAMHWPEFLDVIKRHVGQPRNDQIAEPLPA